MNMPRDGEPVEPATPDLHDSKPHGLTVGYSFQGRPFRSVIKGDALWFVATDVCDALGIANSRNATARLSPKQKGVATMDTPGGPQEVAVVNESGLYKLAFTSRSRGARSLADWA